jgi:hypothetical protein
VYAKLEIELSNQLKCRVDPGYLGLDICLSSPIVSAMKEFPNGRMVNSTYSWTRQGSITKVDSNANACLAEKGALMMQKGSLLD